MDKNTCLNNTYSQCSSRSRAVLTIDSAYEWLATGTVIDGKGAVLHFVGRACEHPASDVQIGSSVSLSGHYEYSRHQTHSTACSVNPVLGTVTTPPVLPAPR